MREMWREKVGWRRWLALLLLGLSVWPAVARAQPEEEASGHVELAPLVAKLLNDQTLSDAERRAMAIFHGQWNTLDDLTTEEAARVALLRFALNDAAFDDPVVPPLLRAEAALGRGECAAVLELLAEVDSAQAAVLRAEAYWLLGRLPEAIAALEPWRERLRLEQLDDAAELTAGARALVMLAHLEGRPSHDFQLAMTLLGKAHQELDLLYWPAKLSEAELLFEKDNAPEAAKAALETLALNPRAGRAWFLLGQLALSGYDFERAGAALDELRRINDLHLLADLLEARMLLQQREPRLAAEVVTALLHRYPIQPDALAVAAAAAALSFDEAGLEAALARCDRLFPGNPLAHYTVGEFLATARQYPSAEAHLRLAIARDENWSAPRLALGMLLMQSGDEDAACLELRRAAQLDPFQKAVQNQLHLVEALLGYETIETPHFVIKYRKGIDEVLARDMPPVLEQIYRDITAIYGFEPELPTLIELMPNMEWFAVRITGMPDIWTVAACTGDVIALVPPREGPKLEGPYDWHTVIRHEFVHTVTLNQTAFRIPHWFTEALAVSQEPVERDFQTHLLLAAAVHEERLFDLDTINWGFIRPKQPQDRAQAYAQANWMVQYLTAAYGHQAILDLLARYRRGEGNKEAMAAVTGRTPETFFEDFKSFARQQVAAWGLNHPPDDLRLDALLSSSRQDRGAMLEALLATHPDQPDVLRLVAEEAVNGANYSAARQAIERYAAARPVDPWASKALVDLALRHGRAEDALGPMERLDRAELHKAVWSRQLAELYRAANRLNEARAAIERGIAREPYNATLRELASALALQAGDDARALHHVYAMTLLEPDRAVQWVRLAALYQRSGQPDKAHEAALKARQVDPNAAVDRFLNPPGR